MATKGVMRREILASEPSNPVAARKSASHDDLKRELSAVKRRKASREASSAVPVVVRYRPEAASEVLSWRFFPADGGAPMDELQFGSELPSVGTLIVLNETTCKVSKHENGLLITAGDLSVRESFDPRRKYITPNGTPVAFKRCEHGRIVLWSYKIQGEIAIGGHVLLERTGQRARPIAAIPRRMTQKLLASYVIAQDPTITGKELTVALQEAFPQCSIGDRHGPHYLSHSRNGKLPEPPDTDPRTWAQAASSPS